MSKSIVTYIKELLIEQKKICYDESEISYETLGGTHPEPVVNRRSIINAPFPEIDTSQFKESQPTEVAGLRSGDWYLNERGNKITVLSVADSWCMVREGDKKPFVVPEEFVLGTFDNSITQ
jgi:hypothetical protein